MSNYHLYAHKNSYAMTTHLMLEELGIDYAITWFNVHHPEEFPDDFLDLNPNARVPVLITPDGPLYESAATMMHLAEHHNSRFLPTSGRPRDLALQWLFYLMSTLQPEVLIQFHAERYFPHDESLRQKIMAASLRELEPIWRVIDDALQPGPYFLGDEYSICDMLFLMQAVWTENQPVTLDGYPNAVRMMQTAFERPAVQRIIAIHNIAHLTELKT